MKRTNTDLAGQETSMMAITIKQPWASLIIHGQKRIENRSRAPWPRLKGHLIGIHASKIDDPDFRLPAGAVFPDCLPQPRGALLGFARIADVVTASQDVWFFGPFGIVLEDVVAYPSPIPMGGALGYWSVLKQLTEAGRARLADATARIRSSTGDQEAAAWLALHEVMKGQSSAPGPVGSPDAAQLQTDVAIHAADAAYAALAAVQDAAWATAECASDDTQPVQDVVESAVHARAALNTAIDAVLLLRLELDAAHRQLTQTMAELRHATAELRHATAELDATRAAAARRRHALPATPSKPSPPPEPEPPGDQLALPWELHRA